MASILLRSCRGRGPARLARPRAASPRGKRAQCIGPVVGDHAPARYPLVPRGSAAMAITRRLCAAWTGQLRCDLSCPGRRRSPLPTEALGKFLRAVAFQALPLMNRAWACPLASSGLEAGTAGPRDWVVGDANIVGRSLGCGGRRLGFLRKLVCVLFVSYGKDETWSVRMETKILIPWQKHREMINECLYCCSHCFGGLGPSVTYRLAGPCCCLKSAWGHVAAVVNGTSGSRCAGSLFSALPSCLTHTTVV